MALVSVGFLRVILCVKLRVCLFETETIELLRISISLFFFCSHHD